MKLKEAKKEAKKLGYNWIFVTASDLIMASKKEPFIVTDDCILGPYLEWSVDGKHIGYYSSNKWWTNTKRKVK